MHTPQPDDLAAWIDAHDPDLAALAPDHVAGDDPAGDASVEEVLERQRDEHMADDGHEVNDDGIGPLVRNVGDDGGAATG